jgi:hypothetical protein
MTLLRTVALVLALVVAAFLHWSLPSRDIVRIVGTEISRETEVTGSGANQRQVAEDVRYIKAISTGGAARVYRNSDTGWGWPPYFKFDEADLAAEAENLVSTAENPRWVVVTHYGWRIPLMSYFPNAVSVRPAEGPDERLIPWFNIAVVTGLIAGLLAMRWRLGRLAGV